MIKNFLYKAVSLTLLIYFGFVLTTYAANTTANINGKVTVDGTPISKKLQLRCLDTGLERTTDSSPNGAFVFLSLSPGNYILEVEHNPPFHIEFKLTIGQQATIDIPLLSASSEIVPVHADNQVEVLTSEQNQTISKSNINNLPTNGRNFIDFTLLTPKVNLGRANTNTTFIEAGLSFGGQRGQNNNVTVDGTDNNDGFNGATRATLPLESVKEFRVTNNMFSAEFGRALGGLIQVATESGTNQHHGAIYTYVRNDALDARNPFTLPTFDTFRQGQYGARAGGPIKQNKLFYFVNYEGQRRAAAAAFSPVLVTNLPAINNRLLQLGLPIEKLDGVLLTQDNDQIFSKLDFQKNNHQLGVRYNIFKATEKNALVAARGGIGAPSNARNQTQREQSAVFSWTVALSPSIINEARFQYARRSISSIPISPDQVNIQIPDVIQIGHQFDQTDGRNEDRWQLSDSVSQTLGHHTIKVGIDINSLKNLYIFDTFYPARVVIPNLQSFLAGPTPTVTLFQQAKGTDRTIIRNSNFGMFLQDQWRISSGLTLNLGLRYDLELLPAFLKRDTNNIQPRVGFAYKLPIQKNSVIRGGYGIFVDRIPLVPIGNQYISGGINLRPESPNAIKEIASISGTTAASAAFVRFLATKGAFPSGYRQLATPINVNLQTPYAQQASLEWSTEITRNLIVNISYLYTHGTHLVTSTNINLAPPTINAEGQAIFADFTGATRFINSHFAQINEVQTVANSNYHGGTVSIDGKITKNIKFIANYTFSRAIDDATNLSFQNQPQNVYNRYAERGLSNEHVGHRCTFNTVIDAPQDSFLKGFSTSTIVVLQSGRPFNVLAGIGDINGDSNAQTDRPLNIGRNTFQGPGFANIDLRISKKFSFGEKINLLLLIEGFNCFNRVNFTEINTSARAYKLVNPKVALGAASNLNPNFRTPLLSNTSFGVGTQSSSPRQIQIGFKLMF